MRINKYLAEQQYASRRGADELIKNGQVFINGRQAVLGDTVTPTDKVVVKKGAADKEPVYYAYNKPIGVVTHSPQGDEKDIKQSIAPLIKQMNLGKTAGASKDGQSVDLFPIGRLDKDSHGLLILTNDGRITGKLLDPDEVHEKEYIVTIATRIPENFDTRLERGVAIEDGNGKRFKTKSCIVNIIRDKTFSIILTEGKKHQIRKMCEAVGTKVVDLQRVRIMDIKLAHMELNSLRRIKGEELESFLKELGVKTGVQR